MKILVNALPKSGTNLLQKLLVLLEFEYDQLGLAPSLVLGKNKLMKKIIRGAFWDSNPVIIGFDTEVPVSSKWLDKRLSKIGESKFISGHANYTEQLQYYLDKNNIKVIHIIRDPRSVLVSAIHYFAKRADYHLYPLYKDKSFDNRLKIILNGGYFEEVNLFIDSFKRQLHKVTEWQDKKNVLIIKFEDLIGLSGGGNSESQELALKKIIRFVEREELIQNNKYQDVASNLFGGTVTFRKGKVDSWKEELSKESLELIEVELSFFLKHWNY